MGREIECDRPMGSEDKMAGKARPNRGKEARERWKRGKRGTGKEEIEVG